MKPIIVITFLALTLAIRSAAQDVRWTFPTPLPSFATDRGYVEDFANDGTGGSAWLYAYDKNGQFAGQRLVWLTKAGKQRLAIDLPKEENRDHALFRMTSTGVYLRVTTSGTSPSTIIKRYRIARGIVQTSEIPYSLLGLPLIALNRTDALGFFSVQSDTNGVVQEVRRYSN